MCGISGVSYGPNGSGAELWSPTEFAQILLPAMVHRGPHAFGYMYYDGEYIVTDKFVGRSDNARVVREIQIPDNIKWLVLHVRYATTGDPANNVNNHPIWHGDLVGVHNGVVRNYKSVLAQTGREVTDEGVSEVDSEAIFAAIQKWGHVKGLNHVDYDGVAVYTNRSQNPWTLHFARTKNRPMVMANTDGGAKIFASEEQIVDATGVDRGPFVQMGKNRLWRIREGKVVERITFRHDVPEAPSMPALPRSSMDRPLSGITDRFHDTRSTAAEAERRARKGKADHERTMKRRAPNQNQKRPSSEVTTRKLQNGDRFGDKFWYEGTLLTESEFLEVVALERAVNDDGAMSDDGTKQERGD